jgi:hypothetical protein
MASQRGCHLSSVISYLHDPQHRSSVVATVCQKGHAQASFLLPIEENKTNMSTNTGDAEKKPIPAWKLRESMRTKGPVPRRSSVQIKKPCKNDGLHAPLPPAFKTMRIQRLAFSKQQDRRKNNDTWVSLNSSHPDKPPSDHINKDGSLLSPDDISDDDDDSFG